jgi:DNA-binding transcriptional MerR regulator
MFTIGEFSRVTGLTVKALRFYHEEGLLPPSVVDEETGYRYYDRGKIDVARAIAELRRLELPLDEIAAILGDGAVDEDVLDRLERHKARIAERAAHYRTVQRELDRFISHEREVRTMVESLTLEIIEKAVEPQLVAGIRTKGRYRDCGPLFGKLARRVGRHIGGPPLMLCYDMEYREEGADFEVAFPIRKRVEVKEATVHELPGGRCLTLIHQGPYEDLGRSYAKILAAAGERGYEVESPCREVYLKGPGMIFKGNPKKYVTELQFLVRERG